MGEHYSDQETALRAIAYELKNPLINIARRAELDVLADIQQAAQSALTLIDSYLLCAQSEYGQVALDLTPTTVGSVLCDSSVQLRQQAISCNAELVIEDRTHEPIMTHRMAITSVLVMFGSIMLHKTEQPQKLILRGYKTRQGGLGVGVFSKHKISQDDLRRALQLQGRAHMPLASVQGSAGVSLSIAESLCRAIGGALDVKHIGGLSGLVTEVQRSEQLAFV